MASTSLPFTGFLLASLKATAERDESPSCQGADCRVGGCVCRSGMHCLISVSTLDETPSPFALADAPSTTCTQHLGQVVLAASSPCWVPAMELPVCQAQLSWVAQGVVLWQDRHLVQG